MKYLAGMSKKKKESKSLGTRDRILHAAAKVIYREGLSSLTSRKIAQEMSAPQSLVFYYFKSKDLIYKALIEWILEVNHQASRTIGRQAKGDRLLSTFIRGNLRWAADNPVQVAVLLSGVLGTSYDRNISKMVHELLSAGEDTVYDLLARGAMEGKIRKDIDLRGTSHFIHKCLIGSTVQIYYSKLTNITDLEESLIKQVSLLLEPRD